MPVLVLYGLVGLIISAVLHEFLQFFHALLGGFHSLPDGKGFIANRGKGSVQFIKIRDTMLGKIVDRCRYGFQFIGCVLLLPTLRILPALFSLNAQILHQQICEVGRLRRLFWGGFPRFEQVGNPLFELSNLRPDFPDKAVCLLDISVQFAFLGGDTFLLHLASRHAHVDGGYLVNAALGVAAVVDALRASGAFKIAV